MPKFADRYEVIGTPLAGGMGAVYPCVDEILERNVAVKVLQNTAEARRLVDEIAALLRLRSKHVVQVYDIIQLDAASIGIVQEYVAGVDLFDAKTNPGTSIDLYKQLWQIASGISDIHEAGVIHRDIKPNNMKVDAEGIIKIFDFGLARDQQQGASTLGFVGTQYFGAPELYGTNVRFTSAVDVYAFGVCAVYLAARGLPDELGHHPPSPIPPGYIDKCGRAIAPDIISAIESCLAANPADRPTISSVRDLLARHLLAEKHQALVVYQGHASLLNASNRTVTAKLDGIGSVTILYDGMNFVISAVSGDVFVNHGKAVINQVLPGSCVVALGAPDGQRKPKYVTFDLSSPEVVL